MWMVLGMLLILVSVVWYVRFLWSRRHMYLHSWNVPGPISFPVIGAGYKFFGNPDDILENLHSMMSSYPRLMKCWLGTRLVYCVYQPEHVEKVLTSPKCLEKHYFYDAISKAIGHGLISSPVDVWKRHRKAIIPSFSQKILESFVDIFVEQCTVFSENLKGLAGKGIVDIQARATALTLDIICETAMGLKMNAQAGNCEFATHLDALMDIATIRIFRVWYHIDWLWNLFPISKQQAKHKQGFDAVITEVIRNKMDALKRRDRSDSLVAQIDEGSKKRKLAFLDLLLENTDFSEKELRDEVNIFLAAGTDTTAVTLCFFLEMLGLHQDIQEKVHEEIVEVLGDRPVEVSDLHKLTYTERVLKETMRLFPIGGFFLRNVWEDLDLGDCIVPQGAGVLISAVLAHRNEEHWPDPLKFDPDRFLPEQVAKRANCAYIPFSYGVRGCIGSKYAMMNMKTFAATTLRKYRFFTKYKSIDQMNLKTKLVLRPKDGFKVYLETR